VLLGRLDEAARPLTRLDTSGLPPSLAAVAELTAAELALRSLRTSAAQDALPRTRGSRTGARSALVAEVAEARAALDRPAARRLAAGSEQALLLNEIAELLASGALVVDPAAGGCAPAPCGCRWAGRCCSRWRARSRGVAGRCRAAALIASAFRTRRPMIRTGRACGSRSAGCARSLQGWRSIEATERASS